MAKLNYQSRGSAVQRRPTGGEATVQEFLPSLVLMGIGLVGVFAFALMHLGTRDTATVMLMLGLSVLVQVALGIGSAFLVAMMIGSSFGELRTAGVKLAGILLFCMALSLWLPMGALVVFFVYLGLLMWMFGLQVYEAVIFAIIFFVVRLAVIFLIA